MSKLARQRLLKPYNFVGVFAALDVGSSQITCLVCYNNGRGDIQILGMGTRRAEGIQAGNVIDMGAAQKSILNAVNLAEQLAGETVEEVMLSVNCGRLNSRVIELELDVENSQVSRHHLNSLHAYARSEDTLALEENDALARLYTECFEYTLDGNNRVTNPVGMSADKIAARIVAVSAPWHPLLTLVDCVERCHLTVKEVVASPIATGMGCLTPEERDAGVTLIDLGAGSASLATYFRGSPIHVEVLQGAGDVLTSDLSAALGCTLGEAERVKNLHGAAFVRPTDASHEFALQTAGGATHHGQEHAHVTRAFVVDILQARLDEIFGRIANRLDHKDMLPYSSRRVVITGGGANLVGLRDYAALRLKRNVRLGRPSQLPGIGHMKTTPNQSNALGLAHMLAQRAKAGVEGISATQAKIYTETKSNGAFGAIRSMFA